MKTRVRPTAIAAGSIVLLILAALTWLHPPSLSQAPIWVLFCGLIAFAATFGIPMAGGAASLLPMLSVASFLVMGLTPAGWAAFCAAILNSITRYYLAIPLGASRRPNKRQTLNVILANGTMNTASILAGGAVYRWAGGALPFQEVSRANWLPLLGLALAYLITNYTLAGAFVVGWKMASLREYLNALKRILAYEALPLIFAPRAALIYTRIGFMQLAFFGAILVGASLIARNLDRTSKRLERRVQELDSLQAVGQALSSSLNIEAVVDAIYEQVRRLMPAANFFVALYNREANEVTFPLAVEEDVRVKWRARRAGEGLTEYLLRTQTPLLMRGNVAAQVRDLGITHIGKEAQCWLGVPILSGAESMGIIALQSFTQADAYDLSHQQLLSTIASQAAVAIKNAQLYKQTDQALAQRVQELDSILHTTQEGVLLLDPEWHVLAVNRALAKLTGCVRTEIQGNRLNTETLALFGYTPEALQAECVSLTRDTGDPTHETIIHTPERRALARTLAPVRSREGTIEGWLLIFRDITEEQQLAKFREDLTNMLVHDLRSPLTVIMGTLALMDRAKPEDFAQLRTMAQHNSERILKMVNELLDISKLESGQLILHPTNVDVAALLNEVSARFAPLATEAAITLESEIAPALPAISADSEILQRVLSNLVDNAIKFTPDGGRIRLAARCEAPDGPNALLLSVSDSGPGIPLEAQGRIFEKFKQAGNTPGRRRGTGLGLAFCRLAAEAHGGRIWVESTPGHGATFTIALPLEP